MPNDFAWSDGLPIRDELAVKFDALPPVICEGFKGPIAPDQSVPVWLAVRVAALRHHGWTLSEAIELSESFPDGFGRLGTESAKVLTELWREKEEYEAGVAATRLAHSRLMKQTAVTTLLARNFPPEECLLGALVTRTSRTFFVGPTGTGKTMFGLTMAGAMVSVQGFLHWQTERRVRVLYVDGEMPQQLLQQRLRDVARRLGGEDALAELHVVSWQDADRLLLPEQPKSVASKSSEAGAMPIAAWAPLNTPEGQSFIFRLCDVIRPDVVIFDNVQCLVAGDMREETPWRETLPLVNGLTRRGIGQVWFDHTGWDATRQYGTSTKAWQFDTVGILKPVPSAQVEPGELAFTLSFDPPGKGRRRTPANWSDFGPCTIRFRNDRWTSEVAGGREKRTHISRMCEQFHRALLDALVLTGTRGKTTRNAWFGECVRLGLVAAIDPQDNHKEREAKRKPFRKYVAELKAAGWIGIDGEVVWTLTGGVPPS
jgi:hypothetical protein